MSGSENEASVHRETRPFSALTEWMTHSFDDLQRFHPLEQKISEASERLKEIQPNLTHELNGFRFDFHNESFKEFVKVLRAMPAGQIEYLATLLLLYDGNGLIDAEMIAKEMGKDKTVVMRYLSPNADSATSRGNWRISDFVLRTRLGRRTAFKPEGILSSYCKLHKILVNYETSRRDYLEAVAEYEIADGTNWSKDIELYNKAKAELADERKKMHQLGRQIANEKDRERRRYLRALRFGIYFNVSAFNAGLETPQLKTLIRTKKLWRKKYRTPRIKDIHQLQENNRKILEVFPTYSPGKVIERIYRGEDLEPHFAYLASYKFKRSLMRRFIH